VRRLRVAALVPRLRRDAEDQERLAEDEPDHEPDHEPADEPAPLQRPR
jgi:hypothetical protein